MGRTSGSVAWRTSRGETGNKGTGADDNSEAIVEGKIFKMGPPVGSVHDDTKQFSDESIIKSKLSNYKLKSVKIWVNDKLVTGLQCSWRDETNKDVITGDWHHGTECKELSDNNVHSLELEENEYVTDIAVRTGT